MRDILHASTALIGKYIITFHLTGLAGPTSQFLNGTHEFSKLVLARMAPLIRAAQFSRSGRSESAGIWRAVAEKMYARALDLSI